MANDVKRKHQWQMAIGMTHRKWYISTRNHTKWKHHGIEKEEEWVVDVEKALKSKKSPFIRFVRFVRFILMLYIHKTTSPRNLFSWLHINIKTNHTPNVMFLLLLYHLCDAMRRVSLDTTRVCVCMFDAVRFASPSSSSHLVARSIVCSSTGLGKTFGTR